MKCFSHTTSETNVAHLSVSPGHVQTDMGNANNRRAPLLVSEVAPKIARLAGAFMDDEEMNGAFVDFEGKVLPY